MEPLLGEIASTTWKQQQRLILIIFIILCILSILLYVFFNQGSESPFFLKRFVHLFWSSEVFSTGFCIQHNISFVLIVVMREKIILIRGICLFFLSRNSIQYVVSTTYQVFHSLSCEFFNYPCLILLSEHIYLCGNLHSHPSSIVNNDVQSALTLFPTCLLDRYSAYI